MEGISMETAVALLTEKASPHKEWEELSLLNALGRIIAEDRTAVYDNPPFDRSPLDGYAVIAADTAGATKDTPVSLRIIGEECAGEFFSGDVHPGEAVRIMTGGAMPEGTDAVVRQEDVKVVGDTLFLPYALRCHENYCFAGEDVGKGTLLLKRGDPVTAPVLAVLAAQGYARVPVFRKPRVLLASTGDELLSPCEALTPGKIYNSNFYLLAARLFELGCECMLLEKIPDDPACATKTLASHAEGIDLILTTGGVSVGKKDIMHEVIGLLGARRLFRGVQMKPGYPLIAYETDGTLGIALSGNPFAAFATFELIVRPVIEKMAGRHNFSLLRIRGVLADEFPKESPGRRFLRAFYEIGTSTVRLPEKHSSGSFFSAMKANALIDVPPGTGKLVPGDEVTVVLLREGSHE